MTATTATELREDASLNTTYRLLWLAVIFDLLAFGVGFNWDRQWHTTHPFEDFFSPPHLFIYTMHFLATITLGYIAFTPELRRWFGPTFRLPLISFPIPGAIGLAAAGFGVVALAGVFDAIWHSAFGLDETNWSFPHSMLGWGLFIAFLGITSCRVALREWRPISWVSAVVFGFLILATSIERFAGPLASNLSPEVIQLIARIPVLAAEPEFQHTTRIYLAADIHRSNPLFVPLVSLSAGMGIGLLRAFDARWWLTVGLTLLLSRTSEFIPYVVPGLIFALGRVQRAGPMIWLLAGAGFAFTTAATWPGTPGGPLIGTVLFMIGGALAQRIWRVVSEPTRTGVLALTALAGVLMPALSGVVDLILRARIP